jgi:hypothetical protein
MAGGKRDRHSASTPGIDVLQAAQVGFMTGEYIH